MKIFYDATKVISGSFYVTSNQFKKEAWGIGLKIDQYCRNEDLNISSMVEKMREKYDKYWRNINNINLMLFIAMVLDSRLRWQCVEWLLKCHMGNNDLMNYEIR